MRLWKRKRDNAALNSILIRRPIQRYFWLFLLPTFAAFCVGFLYPFCKGLFLSFCKFKTTSKWTWVGLTNYAKAIADPSFMHAFWYTAIFALVSLIIINVLAFAVAYVLTQGIKGSNLFRTVFFMPNLIGGIVLGYIWSMIFDGILTHYGTSILLETKYGFWGLIILMCWQQIGYMMIIYIAGLQSVPEDMLEAAKIDGANEWKTYTRITLPLIMPIVNVNILTNIIYGLKMFDIIYVMTGGGPGISTESFGTLIMNEMGAGRYASSVAINLIFTVLLVVVSVLYKKFSRRWETES